MKKDKKKKIAKIIRIAILIVLYLTVVVVFCIKHLDKEQTPQISYSEAQQLIIEGKISSVKMQSDSINVYLYTDEDCYKATVPGITIFSEFLEEQRKDGNQVAIEIVTHENNGITLSEVLTLLSSLMYILFMFVVIKHFARALGANGKLGGIFGKDTDETGEYRYSFKDIAGVDEEIEDVQDIVKMLKNPEAFRKTGARIPKGILFEGKPGTGKTLLAKAIAGETGVNFYSCSGSSFEEVFVGLGASKVRKLFDKAKKNAPSIIFIDEIDSVAGNRYSLKSNNEQTLNQLLSEMDGFDENENVIVIAATNHIEVLDPAITRPGRFDRIIKISLPDKKGRREILEVHSRNKKFYDENHKKDILDNLAKMTSGMSGAILENILNEAAIIAAKNEKEFICNEDVDEAFIKVILGISKNGKEVSHKEKWLTAVHEAGHAIARKVSNPKSEVLQVSIIPRGSAGGYTLWSDDDVGFENKEDLFKSIVTSLGGRAAESEFLGTISVGAASDLQKATETAHDMVYKFAMSDDTELVRLYGADDYNSNLEAEMLKSMKKIIHQAYDEAVSIIKANKSCVEQLANALMEKSTLNSAELEEIFSRCNISK